MQITKHRIRAFLGTRNLGSTLEKAVGITRSKDQEKIHRVDTKSMRIFWLKANAMIVVPTIAAIQGFVVAKAIRYEP